MGKIISAELYKLKKNKAFWLITVVMAIAMAAMTIFMPGSKNMSGFVLSFSDLLPLFSIIVIVSLAQNDANSGTLKNTVSSGISRYNIYFGKMIVAFVAVLILFVIDGIVTIIAASTIVPISLDMALILQGVGSQLLLAINYTIVFYLIGTVIPKGSFAIIISYLLFLFDSLIFGAIGSFMHIGFLSSFTMGGIASALENGHATIGTFGHLGFLTVVFVICAFIGATVFSKQDIK